VCADVEENDEGKVAAAAAACVRGWVRERVRAEGPRVGFLVYTGGGGGGGRRRRWDEIISDNSIASCPILL